MSFPLADELGIHVGDMIRNFGPGQFQLLLCFLEVLDEAHSICQVGEDMDLFFRGCGIVWFEGVSDMGEETIGIKSLLCDRGE